MVFWLTLAVSSCTAMKFKNVMFTRSGPDTTVINFSSSRASGPPKPSTSRILGSWANEAQSKVRVAGPPASSVRLALPYHSPWGSGRSALCGCPGWS